jgi:hypothetical protein
MVQTASNVLEQNQFQKMMRGRSVRMEPPVEQDPTLYIEESSSTFILLEK